MRQCPNPLFSPFCIINHFLIYIHIYKSKSPKKYKTKKNNRKKREKSELAKRRGIIHFIYFWSKYEFVSGVTTYVQI